MSTTPPGNGSGRQHQSQFGGRDFGQLPQDGSVLWTPKLLLDGGRAVRGDVRPPVIAPDKFVTFKNAGVEVVAAAGGLSTPLELRWAFDCYVLTWCFVNVDDETANPLAGMLAVKAQLQLGGPNLQQMITDDSTNVFQPLQVLSPFGQPPTPVYRKASNGTIWTVSFRNDHSTQTYRPMLSFGVRLAGPIDCNAVSPEFVR